MLHFAWSLYYSICVLFLRSLHCIYGDVAEFVHRMSGNSVSTLKFYVDNMTFVSTQFACDPGAAQIRSTIGDEGIKIHSKLVNLV